MSSRQKVKVYGDKSGVAKICKKLTVPRGFDSDWDSEEEAAVKAHVAYSRLGISAVLIGSSGKK